MPTSKQRKSTARSGYKSAPNRPPAKQQSGVPSHVVEPRDPSSNFTGSKIDINRLRQSTDFSGVMRITHDIKIGFNRYEMFVDRFERQKQVVRNNNFKLICGSAGQSKQAELEKKNESVSNQVKDKRMIYALTRLREIGIQLDDMNWGTDFVDEEILDRYVDSLREKIKVEKEKGYGKSKPLQKPQAKKLQIEQPAHQASSTQQNSVPPSDPTSAQKQPSSSRGARSSSPRKKTAASEKPKMFESETLTEAQVQAHMAQEQEMIDNKRIVQKLMQPGDKLHHLTKEEFQSFLERDQVFDEVANQVFTLHNERNNKLNEQHPLMVKMSTKVHEVKKVLKGIDQASFCALRDLQKTPAQLFSAKLQLMSGMQYSVTDDMRDVLGNDRLNQARFCGIMNRLLNQKAQEMGRDKKGYEQFYLDEITNYAHELPVDQKCIQSLLSKENTKRHKQDEIAAKRILKLAAQKQLSASKSNSEERLIQNSDRPSYKAASASRPRIKTLEEINADKAAMLKKQQEKMERDRHLVLENIYLMRLKEAYPDAQIECSEYIQNLIDAYMRRNMVAQEIQTELALEKMKAKKPRPFKIIQGLAVVRPTRFEYLDNDPLGKSPKKKHKYDSDSDNDSKHSDQDQERDKSKIVNIFADKNGEQQDAKEKSDGQDQQLQQTQQLDIEKLMEQEDPNQKHSLEWMNTTHGELFYPKSKRYDQSQIVNVEEENLDDKTTNRVSQLTRGDNPTLDQSQKPAALLNQTSTPTIKESYLASVGPPPQGANTLQVKWVEEGFTGIVTGGSHQLIKTPIQSEHNAGFMQGSSNENRGDPGTADQSEGRESPSFQVNLLKNMMNLGIFEQKSEDISATESKLMQASRGKSSVAGANPHRSAHFHLELSKLRTQSIKETRFMQRVRQEAEKRRARTRGEHHLTLSGMKPAREASKFGQRQRSDGLGRRIVSSARTVEMAKDTVSSRKTARDSQKDQTTALSITQKIPLSNEKIRQQRQDMKGMQMMSHATTAHSYLNSQLGAANQPAFKALQQGVAEGVQSLQSCNTEINSLRDTVAKSIPAQLRNHTGQFSTKNDEKWSKQHVFAKPIQSYTIPLTVDASSQITPKEADPAQKLTATQRRFPMRDTHSVALKRKLEANSSTITASQSRRYLPKSRMTRDSGDFQTNARRPVTGTVRTNHALTKYQTSTAQSTTQRLDSVPRMNVLDQQKRILSSRPDFDSMKLIDSDLNIDEQEQEFAEVTQSQLPDRVLAFMERNDLPVYIDKKQATTYKFRTTGHSDASKYQTQQVVMNPPLQQKPAKQWNLLGMQKAQKDAQNRASLIKFMDSQPLRQSKNMTLVIDPKSKFDKTKGSESAVEAKNLSTVNQVQSKDGSRAMSTKQVGKKTPREEGGKNDRVKSASSQNRQQRRRIVMKNGANQDTTAREANLKNQQPPPRNETPQIINIVGKEQTGAAINQDLGTDLKEPQVIRKAGQNSSLASERNHTYDSKIPLPRPLFQKSKTYREGRNSVKFKHANTYKASSKRAISKNNPHRPNSVSQISEQANKTNLNNSMQQRAKAITPQVHHESAISPQAHDLLSADHPMADYVANATYPQSKTFSPDLPIEESQVLTSQAKKNSSKI